MRGSFASGVLGVLLATAPVWAQAQPKVCENKTQVLRILVEHYTVTRMRDELETATQLARLRKQIEEQRATIEALKLADPMKGR